MRAQLPQVTRALVRPASGWLQAERPAAGCRGAARTLLDWRLKVDEWARAEQRRIDQDRDRNRQEFVALLNSQMWGYWNDPQFGVWSLMKRQDEERFRAAEATRQQLLQQQFPLPILQAFSETAFRQLGASGLEPESLRRWLQERGTDHQVRSWNEALHDRHPGAGPGRTDSSEGSGLTLWGRQPPDAAGRPDIVRDLKLQDPGSVEQVESLGRMLRDSDTTEPRTAAVRQPPDTEGPPHSPPAELERDERARQPIRSLIEETSRPRPTATTDEPAGGRRHERPGQRDGETTRQLDEQDRRHAEITKELHQKLWEYWNDPVIGFFPWLRRQLEEAQRKSEAARTNAVRVRENRPSRKDTHRPGGGSDGGDRIPRPDRRRPPKWLKESDPEKIQQFHESQLGFQVYVLRDSRGIPRYVGRSGGAGGERPLRWRDRLSNEAREKKTRQQMKEMNSAEVYSDLTEAESYALEKDLIDYHKTMRTTTPGIGGYNDQPGTFSFPGMDYAATLQSASRRPVHRFNVEF